LNVRFTSAPAALIRSRSHSAFGHADIAVPDPKVDERQALEVTGDRAPGGQLQPVKASVWRGASVL
jgi:hypothetical protein